jgi:hypothetical protein
MNNSNYRMKSSLFELCRNIGDYIFREDSFRLPIEDCVTKSTIFSEFRGFSQPQDIAVAASISFCLIAAMHI